MSIRKTERRGKYDISVYEVEITPQMRKTALQFAKDLILSDNQYSRLLPEQIRNSGDVSLQQKIEVQRTYVGKLGELAFLNLLLEKGKTVDTTGMLEVKEGQSNVDAYDFITADQKTVDVKTGFRANHTRLLVNVEQFDRHPKDIYVGVKLNAIDVDPDLTLVDWDSITQATVKGYAEYAYMKGHAKIIEFGEGPARALPYNNLLGIDRLVKMF